MAINRPQDDWQDAAGDYSASVAAYVAMVFDALPRDWEGRSMVENGYLRIKVKASDRPHVLAITAPLKGGGRPAKLLAIDMIEALMAQREARREYDVTRGEPPAVITFDKRPVQVVTPEAE